MRARRQADQDVSFGMVLRRAAGHRGLDPFYTGLLEGLEERLESADAHILLHLVDSLRDEIETYRRWSEAGLATRVVLADLSDDDERPQVCRALGLEVVQLGGRPSVQGTTIDVDNRGAMHVAVDYLAGLGHRSIARVSGPPRLVHTHIRAEAFDARTEAAGVRAMTVEGDYSADSGAACTRRVLDVDPSVTAILFDNDVMAVAALEVARERGLVVPDDLSVLAWDDSPLCQLAQPPLSVVYRDVRSLGDTVGEVLLAPADDRIVRVSGTHIVQRASTARAPI